MMVDKKHSTSPKMVQSQSWKEVTADSFFIARGEDGTIRKQVVKALAGLNLPKPSQEQVEVSTMRAVLDFSANLSLHTVLAQQGEVDLRIFIAQMDNRVKKGAQSSFSWGYFLVQNSTSQPGLQILSLDIYLYQE